MAGTRTPQGVLAVVRIPVPRRPPSGAGFTLAVDGLADPGNLGTLLRVALAFGAAGVVLGCGTADPWSQKTLRASAGAAFHLPPLLLDDLAAWLRERPGARWELAPRRGEPLDRADLSADGPLTLVVGSEARGVSPAVAALCRPLTVPMPGPAESLNAAVAAAIACYEVMRRRRADGACGAIVIRSAGEGAASS